MPGGNPLLGGNRNGPMTRSVEMTVRQLDRELYALVTHICLSSGFKKGDVRRHLEDFAAWVGKTAILEKIWARELAEKTQGLRLSLENGRSEEELFEPLLRCVIEASGHIQLLLSDLEKQDRFTRQDDPETDVNGSPMKA
jgi:hypothetical protein